MDRSLRDLYQQGVITYETAISHATVPDTIQQAVPSSPAARVAGR